MNNNKKVKPELRPFSQKKMLEAFAFMEKALQIFLDMDPNSQRFSNVMHASHEAFSPFHVILEEMKNAVQGTLDHCLIKKRIEQRQQQPESAVDTDDPQTATSVI